MYLYPRIISIIYYFIPYFHNYHTIKRFRQLDVSLNTILYLKAQNYENHFKDRGSQTPGFSSKTQVTNVAFRCSTGYSQIL